MSIQQQIETAQFGDMFLTADGSRALFLRRCENAEWKMADFYVEHWGMIRVNRETGHVLFCKGDVPTSNNNIIKKA